MTGRTPASTPSEREPCAVAPCVGVVEVFIITTAHDFAEVAPT